MSTFGDARRSNISGVAIAVAFAGAVLAYSGVKGYSISNTIRDIIAGKGPSGEPQKPIVQPTISSPTYSPGEHSGQYGGSNPANAAANQATAKLLAAPFGWSTGSNWDSLVKLWNQESGWSQYADTRVSGLDPPNATVYAYGIAQARPATKYPPGGLPPISSPQVQIAWGLAYILARYGSPDNAWQHEQDFGWY